MVFKTLNVTTFKRIWLIRSFSCSTKDRNSECLEYTTTKCVSQAELDEFSRLTGDFNTVHSGNTPVPKRKVHGAFLNAIVSGIMGTFMPGPGTIVLEQNFRFPKACRVDTDIEIKIRLVKKRKISIAEYSCRQKGDIVFEGEAKLLIKNAI